MLSFAPLQKQTNKQTHHVQILYSTVIKTGSFGSTTTQCFDLAIRNGSRGWYRKTPKRGGGWGGGEEWEKMKRQLIAGS